MKAITLHQPWATLVAIGAKRIETRSWATRYRGPLAIHAGKNMKAGLDMITQEPFLSVLADAGVVHLSRREFLPFGKVVAICDLVDCRKMGKDVLGDIEIEYGILYKDKGIDMRWPLTAQEKAFGLYQPGRYAWLLANIRPLAQPIPATGARLIWEWEAGPVTLSTPDLFSFTNSESFN